jgi:hypothetical protein
MSRGTLLGMGEVLRSRVLRALGLENVWLQLEALGARLKRVEQDVVALQRAPRGQTIPASPPPPPKSGDEN